MTNTQNNADELFQATWFRVITNIRKYKHQNFYGWLIRIAHNIVIDKARKRKADVSLDENINDTDSSLIDRIPAKDNDASREVSNKQLAEKINYAIKQLPEKQREVFMMRTYEGLSFKTIARIQKTSINTALARMQYAITKLQPILEEEYNEL